MKKIITILSLTVLLTSCSQLGGLGVEIRTDYGTIHGSKSGVSGEIIIDQTSGK